ncbi:MAG: hydroxypyruvate reductase [Acidobacteria bacterium]|nr:MAG: hydroxypyruvate reductase [Acidobacteriota bacterium]
MIGDQMDGKQLARQIFLRTLDALNVPTSISRCVSCAERVLRCGDVEYDLHHVSDLRVIAAGKAAYGMLDGLTSVLPAGLTIKGIVSAPGSPKTHHPGLRYFSGGHPTPNEQSLLAGEAALDLLRGCSVETLVIVLLSGGGSSLVELPLLRTLSLSDVQQLHRALVNCGASIAEINTIRKHISAVKGGRLAQAAAPASVIALAISDVPVGKESALASGPTLPDPTTRDDVARIFARYDLRNLLPQPLIAWIESAQMPETPKAGDPVFERAQFQLVLGMHELFHAAHRIAESQDCLAFCDNSTDDWPVEKAADFLLAQLEELRAANPRQPVALIADGELSSTVTGDGLGGRNSAFVLACVRKIARKRIVVLSAGTDGVDGNSPAAGAVADGNTLSRASAAGLDPNEFYRQSDSFSFFDVLGDAIATGPTGNNLRDMRLLIALI